MTAPVPLPPRAQYACAVKYGRSCARHGHVPRPGLHGAALVGSWTGWREIVSGRRK